MEAEIWATEIGALCARRKWTRARLVHELRRVAAARKIVLPEASASTSSPVAL